MKITDILYKTERLPVDADRIKVWLNSAMGVASYTVNGDEILHLVPAGNGHKATVFSATRRVATPIVDATGDIPAAWRPVDAQALKNCGAL